MNIQALTKRDGKLHKLRPLPKRITLQGQPLEPQDDDWLLRMSTAKRMVELTNNSTGHVLTLGPDNIREFRTPNFLLLRCDVILHGPKVIIEPHLMPAKEQPPGDMWSPSPIKDRGHEYIGGIARTRRRVALENSHKEERKRLWDLRGEGVQLRNEISIDHKEWHQRYENWHARLLEVAAALDPELKAWLHPLNTVKPWGLGTPINSSHLLQLDMISETLDRVEQYLNRPS